MTTPAVEQAEVDVSTPLAFGNFRRRTAETFASLVVSTVVSAAYAVFVARMLGPAGKGVVSVVFLLPSLAALLLIGTLELANTYFGANRPDARAALLANGLVVSVAGGIIVAAILFGALYAGGVSFGASWTELTILLASIAPTCVGRVVTVLVLASGRTLAFNLLGPLSQAAMLAFTAAAFAIFGAGVLGVITAYAASQVVAMAAALAVFWTPPARPEAGLLNESVRYGLRGMLGNLVQFFNYRLDFFLLSSLRSSSAVGVYSIAVTLAELVLKIPSAASTILFPRVAAGRQGDPQFTLRVARAVMLLTVFACLVLLAGAWFLIGPVFGARFAAAFAPLALLLPGVLALAVTNVLASDFAGRGEPQYLTYSAVIGLVFTIVLNILLVPPFGASGAAIASTIAYSAAAVFVVVTFVRRFALTMAAFVPRRDDFGSSHAGVAS